MSQKTKFAQAAKACRGISSRARRNACVREHLKGRGGRRQQRLGDFGSPKGRRHRGGKRRLRSYSGTVSAWGD